MALPEAARVAAPAGEHPTAAGRVAVLTPSTAPVSAVPVPAALKANAPARPGPVPVEGLVAVPQVRRRAAAAPRRLPPIGPSIVQEGRKPALEREPLGPPVPIWQERRLPAQYGSLDRRHSPDGLYLHRRVYRRLSRPAPARQGRKHANPIREPNPHRPLAVRLRTPARQELRRKSPLDSRGGRRRKNRVSNPWRGRSPRG